MSKYSIEWVEAKNPDWLIAVLKGEDGNETRDVSINRKNKKGEIFPNFDDIKNGGEIEGDLWHSDSNKWYLFAPKPPKTVNSGAYKAKLMNDVMEKKEQSIAKFQGNKEQSIALMSAERDAVLIVTTFYRDEHLDAPEIKDKIIYWRNFFLSQEFTDSTIPF